MIFEEYGDDEEGFGDGLGYVNGVGFEDEYGFGDGEGLEDEEDRVDGEGKKDDGNHFRVIDRVLFNGFSDTNQRRRSVADQRGK